MLYYLPEFRVKEEEIGFMLARQALYPCDKIAAIKPGDINGIANEQSKLDDRQMAAVENACTNNLSILCGRAGTGKTTTLKAIANSFIGAGMNGIAMCPTGKAAKRFQEVVCCGDKINSVNLPSKTIASALRYYNGRFTVDENDTLDYDFVIVDEASMCGVHTFNALLRAIDWKRTRIVITGDHNQLPSIEPGNILNDLISCGEFKCESLTKIYRQDKNSGIVYNASRVIDGEMISISHHESGVRFADCDFIKTDKECSRDAIIKKVVQQLPADNLDPVKDIQVLCPGKRGEIGTEELNKSLRAELNVKKRVNYMGFMVGDKVINRKNNYGLCIVNGDVGFVKDIGKTGITVDFGEGSGSDGTGIVEMNSEAAASLKLAYAYTVHSSQGSEFKCCVIPIYSTHWMLLFRNLLYTAMTRPRQKLVLYYDLKSMHHCIKNNSQSNRATNLVMFIKKYISYFGSRKGPIVNETVQADACD